MAAKVVSGLGAVGCAVSLAVVVSRSVVEDPVSMIVLVVLAALALGAEHLVFKKRRVAIESGG